MVLTENERKEFIEIGQLMKKQIRTMMFGKDFNELMRQYMKLYVGLHAEDEETYQRQKEKLNDERLFTVNNYLIATENVEENMKLIEEINKNEEIAKRNEKKGAKIMKKERMLKSIVDDEIEGLVKRKETSKNIEVLRHYLNLRLSLYFNEQIETEIERYEIDWALQSVLVKEFARFLDNELKNEALVDYLAQSKILSKKRYKRLSIEEKKNKVKEAIQFDYLVEIRNDSIARERRFELKGQITKLEKLVGLKTLTNKDEELVRKYLKNALEEIIEFFGSELESRENAIQQFNEYLDEVSLDEYIEYLNSKRKDENVTKGLADIDDKIHFIDSRNHVGLVTQDFKIKRFRKILGTEYVKHLA